MLHGLDLRYTPYKTYLWTCAGYIDEAPLQLHAFVSPEGEERFGGHESCHARGKTCLNHKLKTFIPGLGHQRSFESQRPVFSGNFPFEEKPSCKAWLWYKLILFYYGHSWLIDLAIPSICSIKPAVAGPVIQSWRTSSSLSNPSGGTCGRDNHPKAQLSVLAWNSRLKTFPKMVACNPGLHLSIWLSWGL